MKTLYLLILFLLILFLQSCGKENNACCDPQKFNYFTITEAARKQTPYFTNPAFDTLSFVSHEEDTIIFVKTKTDSTWYCEYASGNPDNNTQNCYQILHNTYKTIKGNGSFDVKHSLKGNQFTDGIEFVINGFTFLIGDYQIGSNKYWTFRENKQLGNKIYDSLVMVYPNSYDSLTAECYINREFGAFFINDKVNSATWQLNK
ncbi:MAG: hypothetical protein V4620_00075 [Bacteroidota bacterium]